MTRRLTLTMVAVVAGALLVAGFGSFALLALQARNETVRDLRRQAQAVAATVEDVANVRNLRTVGAALKLEGERVMRFGPAGRTPDVPPAGVSVSDIDVTRLRAGETVSGVNGGLAFAAAPANRPNALVAVVLTRRVPTGRRGAAAWLLLASGLALAVAAAVAANLGRRLTQPLREAEAATRRIAEGDLAARVPEAQGDDELAALSRSINAMAVALERSRGLERQFLLAVSHDLRTPLTSIRGYAEALTERKAKPAQAAAVILSESRRLERLVGDLLELAKLESRRFSLDMRATDVAEVVTDTAEGFRPAAEEAGVKLVVRSSAAPGALMATADRDRLAQVVANLVENALKFAARSITVGTGRAQGQVSVWVEDDGPGIPSEDLANVFERFYMVTRTPARHLGSGLGLAIVRELVDAMGGEVRAESGAGRGARMVVVLRSPGAAVAA